MILSLFEIIGLGFKLLAKTFALFIGCACLIALVLIAFPILILVSPILFLAYLIFD